MVLETLCKCCQIKPKKKKRRRRILGSVLIDYKNINFIDTKTQELSKLQLNVDDVTKSMIKHSNQKQQFFESSGINVKIKKLDENSDLVEEIFTNQNGDIITVTSNNNAKSIGFYGFSNIGCIIDNKYDW